MRESLINLLLIEDNPGDVRLIQEMLKEIPANPFRIFFSDTALKGLKTLSREKIDLIFLDLSLPDSQGIETFIKIRSATSDRIPIIVLTGLDSDETALISLKEGAQDYLIKGKMDYSLLVRSARYAIERHKMKTELQQKTRELEQSNQELEQFAYLASHDLQEPLNTLISFGDLLKTRIDGTSDSKILEYLERMRNTATRMKNLVQDLLELSQVTTRAKPFEPINLEEVIHEALSDLEGLLTESKGKIKLGSFSFIKGDRDQIRQLFQNLIENALKFRKTDSPSILITEQKIKNHLEIKIKDNGIGFDESSIDDLFKPFKRLHPQNKYKGSGIGLATCKKIVERHQGILRAESKLGKGSTFIIIFPLFETYSSESNLK